MSGMQKRFLTCLLVICMVMSLTACGRVKEAANVLLGKEEATEEVDVEAEEEDEEEKDKKKEKEEKEAKEEAPEEEPTPEKEKAKNSSGFPVLGETDIEDFDGYTYLYCEKLRTESTKNEKTGKMESFELPVFIPLDEYVYVNRDYVSGNKLGVEYKISIEPSMRYDAEDYLMTENLDYYLENQYDPYYSENYKDIVIGEAEEIGENATRATVEYCYYDKYDDSLTPTLCTYYYAELESGVEVLVEFNVNADEVTGKTPDLIDELETFYPFEINWDADRAADKLETYLASGGENSFSTGYLLFELPDGWAEDTSVGDFDYQVYAPDGDVELAGCFVGFQKEYLGYGSAKDAGILKSEDAMVEAVQAMVDETEIGGTVSYYGDTCMGKAAVVETSIEIEDGEMADAQMYFMFDDSYMYMAVAAQAPNATEDPVAVVLDVLENGQIRE